MEQKNQNFNNIPPMPQMPPKKKKSKRWIWITLALIIIPATISGIFSDDTSNNTDNKDKKVTQMSKEEWTKILITDLDSSSEYIDSVINRAKETKAPEMLRSYVSDMNNIADKKITDSLYMDVYSTPEISEKMEANSKKAKSILPQLKKIVREKYVKALGDKLWENNIYVESSGTTITFIGAVFANNKNIKDWEEELEPQLQELGFKQVRYKWIKHDDEYTYYNI